MPFGFNRYIILHPQNSISLALGHCRSERFLPQYSQGALPLLVVPSRIGKEVLEVVEGGIEMIEEVTTSSRICLCHLHLICLPCETCRADGLDKRVLENKEKYQDRKRSNCQIRHAHPTPTTEVSKAYHDRPKLIGLDY